MDERKEKRDCQRGAQSVLNVVPGRKKKSRFADVLKRNGEGTLTLEGIGDSRAEEGTTRKNL